MSVIKNLGKSFLYSIPSALGTVMPTVADYKRNISLPQQSRKMMIDHRRLVERGMTKWDDTGGNLMKNLKNDIKNGTSDNDTSDFFDDGFDDDFDFEDDVSETTTSDGGTNIQSNKIIKDNRKTMNQVNINGPDTEVVANEMKKQSGLNILLNDNILRSMSVMSEQMNQINQFNQEATLTHYQKTGKYRAAMVGNMADINNKLEKLVDLQTSRNKFMGTDEDESIERRKSQFDRVISYNGQMSFSNYMSEVVKNAKSGGGMFGMLLEEVIANPLKFVMEETINAVIPQSFKDSMKNLDDIIKGLPSAFILKMNDWALEDNPFKKFLGGMLGLSTGWSNEPKSDIYKKGSTSFDGVTRKAITEVIPTLLSKIHSAISGQKEMVYDYEEGVFRGKQKLLDDRKDSIRNIMSGRDEDKLEVYNGILKDKGITADSELGKSLRNDIDKILDGYNMRGKSPDKALTKKHIDGSLNNSTSVDMVNSLIQDNPELAMKISSSIVGAQDSYKDFLFKEGSSVDFADSGIMQALNDRQLKKDFNSTRDTKNSTFYDKKNKKDDKDKSVSEFMNDIFSSDNKFTDKAKKLLSVPFKALERGADKASKSLANVFFGNDKNREKDDGLFNSIGKKFNESIFKPLNKLMFGDKDSNGNVPSDSIFDKGIFTSVKEWFSDYLVNPTKNFLFSEQEMDAKGNIIKSGGVITRFKNNVSNISANISESLFGENGYADSVKEKGMGILESFRENMINYGNKVEQYLFGELDSDGNRVASGVINEEVKTSLAHATAGSLLGSMFIPGYGKVIGAVAGYVHGMDNVQEYLYDKDDGLFYKWGRNFKQFFVGEEELDSEGNVIKKRGILKNAQDTITDNIINPAKNYLFGEEYEKDGKLFRSGGFVDEVKIKTSELFEKGKLFLLGDEDNEGLFSSAITYTRENIYEPIKRTIFDTFDDLRTFMTEEVFNPIKKSMRPFWEEFKVQMGNFKDWGSSVIKHMADNLNESFAKYYGTTFSETFHEKIVEPMSDALDTIKNSLINIFKSMFKLPVSIIKDASESLRNKHRGMNLAYAGSALTGESDDLGIEVDKKGNGILNFMSKEARARRKAERKERKKADSIEKSSKEREATNIKTTAEKSSEIATHTKKTAGLMEKFLGAFGIGSKGSGSGSNGISASIPDILMGNGSISSANINSKANKSNKSKLDDLESIHSIEKLSSISRNTAGTKKYTKNIALYLRRKFGNVGLGGKMEEFEESIKEGKGFFGKAFKIISFPFKSMSNVAGQTVKSVQEMGKGLWKIAKLPMKLVSLIGETVKTIGPTLAKGIGKGLNVAVDVVSGAIKSAGNVISSMADNLTKITTSILDNATKLAQSIGKVVTGVTKMAMDIIPSVLRGLGGLGKSMIDMATSPFRWMASRKGKDGKDGKSITKKIKDKIMNVRIVDIVPQPPTKALPFYETEMPKLGSGFIGAPVVSFVDKIKAFMSNLFKGGESGEEKEGIFAKVKNFIKAPFGKFKEKFTEKTGKIARDSVINGVHIMKEDGSLDEVMGDVVDSSLGIIKDKTIGRAKRGIKNVYDKTIGGGVAKIKGSASKLRNKINTKLEEARERKRKKKELNYAKNTATNTGEISKSQNKFTKLLTTLFPILLTALSSLAGLFAGTKIAEFGGRIVEFVSSNFLDPIKDGIVGMFKTIGKGFSWLGGAIKSKLISLGGKAKSLAVGGLSKIGMGGSAVAGAGVLAGVGTGLALMKNDFDQSTARDEKGMKRIGAMIAGHTGDSFGGMMKNAGKQALKYGAIGAGLGLAGGPFAPISVPLGGLIGSIGGFTAGIFGNDPKESIDTIRNGVGVVKDFVARNMDKIEGTMRFIVNPVGELLGSFFNDGSEKSFIQKGIYKGWVVFSDKLFGFADRLTGGLLSKIEQNPLFRTLAGGVMMIGDVLSKGLKVLGDLKMGALKLLGLGVKRAIELPGKIIKGIFDFGGWIGGKIGDLASKFFGEGSMIGGLVRSIKSFISPMVDAVNAILDKFNIGKRIKKTASNIKDGAVNLKDNAIDWVTDSTQAFRDRYGKSSDNRSAVLNAPESKDPSEVAGMYTQYSQARKSQMTAEEYGMVNTQDNNSYSSGGLSNIPVDLNNDIGAWLIPNPNINGGNINLSGIHPALLARSIAYAKYKGTPLTVNSGYRSIEEQRRLYNDPTIRAARPGSSWHNFGGAIDINGLSGESDSVLNKFGLSRPVSGESWHVEPSELRQENASRSASGVVNALKNAPTTAYSETEGYSTVEGKSTDWLSMIGDSSDSDMDYVNSMANMSTTTNRTNQATTMATTGTYTGQDSSNSEIVELLRSIKESNEVIAEKDIKFEEKEGKSVKLDNETIEKLSEAIGGKSESVSVSSNNNSENIFNPNASVGTDLMSKIRGMKITKNTDLIAKGV